MTGLEHDGPITGLAFHPTGRTLAYAAVARGGIWREPPEREAPAETPSVWRRRFARETPRPFTGVRLYSLTGTDEFVPNRVRLPRPEDLLIGPQHWARGLAFTPDGRVMLAGQIEVTGLMQTRARIYHWHFTEEEDVWRADAGQAAGCGATENGGALIGDSHLALTGAWGVTVCPVSEATGLYVPDVRAAGATAVAPARELVAVVESGSLTVWHLRQTPPMSKPKHAAGLVTAVAFSPDGGTLAVGHSENTVTFWDPVTGRPGWSVTSESGR
jgi:WD40 repeat protein